MLKNKKISIVAPAYNEEAVLPFFFKEIETVLIGYDYELILVDDGSLDKTYQIMRELSTKNKRIKLIKFKGNFGQQSAILAGLERSSGDCSIITDSDLQDSPSVILEMLQEWQNGYKSVLARRISRQDNVFKRITAFLFYRLLCLFSKNNLFSDISEFCLIDSDIREKIIKTATRPLYLRGLIARRSMNSKIIFFRRQKRHSGKSHYTFPKMLKLAKDGFLVTADRTTLFLTIFFVILILIIGLFLTPLNSPLFWIDAVALTIFFYALISLVKVSFLKIDQTKPFFLIEETRGFDE
jgi:dolichol-phosphate mannosyltransferase